MSVTGQWSLVAQSCCFSDWSEVISSTVSMNGQWSLFAVSVAGQWSLILHFCVIEWSVIISITVSMTGQCHYSLCQRLVSGH